MTKAHMVSVREFRADMTRFLKEAQEKDMHLVLMRHSTPVARIIPFDRGTTLEEVTRNKTSVERKQPKGVAVKKNKTSKSQRKPAAKGWRKMFGF